MGSSESRRMEDIDEALLDESSDVDGDIAQLLQYLIRSGQVHIIAADGENSVDEDDLAAVDLVARRPRTVNKPITDVLDESAFKVITSSAAGQYSKGTRKRPHSLPGMVSFREYGINRGPGGFTGGDRARITSDFLPNHRTRIDSLRSKIFCGTFSQDGSTFLTASQDKKIRLYDARNGLLKPTKTILGRNVGWSILDTAFSPDGQYVAYSSWSESLHIFPLHGDTDHQDALLMRPLDRRFCVFSLSFSSDGNEILCGGNDSCLYIFDRQANMRILKICGHDDDVNAVAFADDSSQIVYSGGDDGVVKVWDRRTLFGPDPTPVGMLAGHMDGVTFIEPRGDGRHLLSNSKDQSIKLWDVRKFSGEEALLNTRKAVEEQSWDYRWQGVPRPLRNPRKRVEGDTSIMTYCGHAVLQTLCRCHFSPAHTTGQRYIYTGCASGRIVIYDSLTGQIAKELKAHNACVRDLSWHPYLPTIVSTSWDGFVHQWEYNAKMEDSSSSTKPSTIERFLRASSSSDDASSSGSVRRSQRIREQRERNHLSR